MKIFIATSFEAKHLFNEYRNVLVEQGHEVYDWTTHPPVRPYAANIDLVREHSNENVQAIVSAGCFVMVTDPRSKSALVELGIAIQSNNMVGAPKIFVIGDDISMYIYHPTVNYVSNLDEVIKWIKLQP